MNHTTIEWVKNPDGTPGHTCNVKTGCLNHNPDGFCLGGMFPCYAYKLANRRVRKRYLSNIRTAPVTDVALKLYKHLIDTYNDPFYPRFWPERLREFYGLGKGQFGMAVIPRGVFLDDMSDWMADYWPQEWTKAELQMMQDCSQHRIYTLTKQAQNLVRFSPFPDNCWVGVTVTNGDLYLPAIEALADIEAKIRYISFEPLLENPSDFAEQWSEGLPVLDWLIIGALTGSKIELQVLQKEYPSLTLLPLSHNRYTLQPKIEWVKEIVETASEAGIPVFLKNNLMPLIIDQPRIPEWSSSKVGLRQEMPKEEENEVSSL